MNTFEKLAFFKKFVFFQNLQFLKIFYLSKFFIFSKRRYGCLSIETIIHTFHVDLPHLCYDSTREAGIPLRPDPPLCGGVERRGKGRRSVFDYEFVLVDLVILEI